jgi:hypothetical protein
LALQRAITSLRCLQALKKLPMAKWQETFPTERFIQLNGGRDYDYALGKTAVVNNREDLNLEGKLADIPFLARKRPASAKTTY